MSVDAAAVFMLSSTRLTLDGVATQRRSAAARRQFKLDGLRSRGARLSLVDV
jgi:hypothetical protein